MLQTSTGDFLASIGTYGFINGYTFKATAAGTLTGFVSGSDSNSTYCSTPYDESATVTVTVASNCSQAVPTPIPSAPGCPVQGWTPGEKKAAIIVAAASTVIGTGITIPTIAAAICVGLTGPAAAVCIAAINFTGWGISSANIILGAFGAIDPPDPNFMVIAQPMIPTYTPIAAQPGITPALAAALNALNTSNIQAIAYAQAAITSGNRASGAANAGNAFWESAQFQAEQGYSNMLIELIQAEPGLLASLQNAWRAGGYGAVTITTAQVLANETAILQNGLPASVVQMLTQAGVDSATIALVQNYVDAMDVTTVASTFPAQLTNPSLVSAVQNFIDTIVIPVGPGLCVPFPVTLEAPAGPNGAFITLTSSDPSKVTLAPGNVNSTIIFIPAGATTPDRRMPEVCGVNFGSATVTALGGGLSSSQVVQVTAALSFAPASVTMTSTRQDRLTLNLSAPAPVGGVTVNLSSDNPGVAAVPATVTIPANAISVIVPVTGVAAGSTLIHASALPNVPDTVASVTVM